jgi:hypothetical protein
VELVGCEDNEAEKSISDNRSLRLWSLEIHFDMLDKKFIFRNVDDEFLKDFSIVEFVKLFGIEIQWYYFNSFDKIVIRGEQFLIIEFTKKKIVLVRSNN